MKTKKLVLFGGVALVVAGGLLYMLGIFPPASSRAGQGAIGRRDVFRSEQPADVSVTPGAAPIASQANSEAQKKLQSSQANQVNSGVASQVSNGVANEVSNGVANQVNNGVANQVSNGVANQVSNGVANQMNNGAVSH